MSKPRVRSKSIGPVRKIRTPRGEMYRLNLRKDNARSRDTRLKTKYRPIVEFPLVPLAAEIPCRKTDNLRKDSLRKGNPRRG